MRAPHPDHIGGGIVQQTFRTNGRSLFAGMKLTRDDLVKMPAQNRNALIEAGRIVVWPRDAGATPSAAPSAAGAQRFVSPRGFGKYDVIEGRKVNAEPVSREEAHALAGIPMPEAKNGN